MVTMSKRIFYRMFKAAWEKAFIEQNIQHTFKKPGIWPVYGNEMIKQVTRPTSPPPTTSRGSKTLLTSKSLRRAFREFKRSPSKLKVARVFTSATTLSSKVSILEHENWGLRMAIMLENQKRKRGKRLNLAGEESKGVEVYSSGKVIAARAYQVQKDDLARAEEEAKEAMKVKRAANALRRREKEKEANDKRADKQLAKDLATANPETPTCHRIHIAVPPKRTAPRMRKVKRSIVASRTKASKCSLSVSLSNALPQGVVAPEAQSRGGRRIRLPQRLRE